MGPTPPPEEGTTTRQGEPQKMHRNSGDLESTGVCHGPCLCCAREKLKIALTDADECSTISVSPSPLESEVMLPKRHAPLTNLGPADPVWDDPEFLAAYPYIMSFLLDTKYSDGSSRIPGTLAIFTQAGALKVAVNDRDRGVTAFVTAEEWTTLFISINEGIANDTLPWKAGNKVDSTKKPTF